MTVRLKSGCTSSSPPSTTSRRTIDLADRVPPSSDAAGSTRTDVLDVVEVLHSAHWSGPRVASNSVILDLVADGFDPSFVTSAVIPRGDVLDVLTDPPLKLIIDGTT